MATGGTRSSLLVGLASLAATAASGLLAAVLIVPRLPGAAAIPVALWGLVALPLAAAVVVTGALSRTPARAALHAALFLVPPGLGALAGFALLMHPRGPTRPDLLLESPLFWFAAATAYLLVLAAVGLSAALFRVVLRPPREGRSPEAPGAKKGV